MASQTASVSFGQPLSRHWSEARSDPPPSSRCRAVHEQEGHHVGISTRLPTPKLCWFFFQQSFTHPLDDTLKEQSKDCHSVPASQDVHTQGHFQQQLSFLEISLTSTTGPQGLQRPHRRQSPLPPGCTSPASFSLALGRAAFPLSVPLLCHLPSTPAWLWSQAEHLHLLGLGHLVLCWPVTSLSVFPVP